MAKYTASLTAQNTNVYICDIHANRGYERWFASAMAGGAFGTGTVTFNLSPDQGVTLYPMNQDGTNSAASLTATGALNLASGMQDTNLCLRLYASIGAATNPNVSITVCDNN